MHGSHSCTIVQEYKLLKCNCWIYNWWHALYSAVHSERNVIMWSALLTLFRIRYLPWFISKAYPQWLLRYKQAMILPCLGLFKWHQTARPHLSRLRVVKKYPASIWWPNGLPRRLPKWNSLPLSPSAGTCCVVDKSSGPSSSPGVQWSRTKYEVRSISGCHCYRKGHEGVMCRVFTGLVSPVVHYRCQRVVSCSLSASRWSWRYATKHSIEYESLSDRCGILAISHEKSYEVNCLLVSLTILFFIVISDKYLRGLNPRPNSLYM